MTARKSKPSFRVTRTPRKATARIVPVERHHHPYEAQTEIEGTHSGKPITDTFPLIDREQVEEWKRHFIATAKANGYRVKVTDTTRGR